MLNNPDTQTVLTMIGICAAFMAAMVFSRQLKVLLKIAAQGVLGMATVWLVNLIVAPFGFSIGINLLNAAVVSFLGIPGIVTLYACRIFF